MSDEKGFRTLADKNQTGQVGAPSVGSFPMGGDLRKDSPTYNGGNAFPGDNQERVLGEFQVMSRGPRWSEIEGGDASRTVEFPTDYDSGTKIGEKDRQTYKVPGLPHYGGEGGNESASSNAS